MRLSLLGSGEAGGRSEDVADIAVIPDIPADVLRSDIATEAPT